jgi:uncharacterized protein (TIGR03083 family)
VSANTVSQLTPERYAAEITASTAVLATLIDRGDPAQPVPSCPDWTLRQLATHVGRGHRWAAEIVRTRSTEFIPFREVPDGRLPDDPAQRPGWLTAGADRLITEVGQAGTDPVWAFGTIRPSAFWARRMAHETAVHRADGEIAVGTRPVIDPVVAADGLAEWLGFLPDGPAGQQADHPAPVPEGKVIHFHATDVEAGGEWLIHGVPGGVTVAAGHGKGDLALRGPASAILLVLLRRLPADDSDVEVIGDRSLLDGWLAATPF